MNQEECIIMFLRLPEKGTVKTRLSTVLDEQAVLELYRCFVLDLLHTLSHGTHEVRICFYPGDAERNVREWLGDRHTYRAQTGNNLGERLEAAFGGAFADGFRKVVLIGSDSPDLPAGQLKEALDALEKADAVLGPSLDGGYYLIGFRAGRLLHEAFTGIEWGTATVFERTMQVLAEHAFNVHVLPLWRDIDTYADLVAFAREHEGTGPGQLLTLDYLRENRLIP